MCEGYTVHHDGAPSKVRHLSSVASDWQGNVPGGGEGSGNILSHMHRLHTHKYTHAHKLYTCTHTSGMMKLVVSSSACFLIIIFCKHMREHTTHDITSLPDQM